MLRKYYIVIFLIFDSFHFLNYLMIVGLQKTSWNPVVAV